MKTTRWLIEFGFELVLAHGGRVRGEGFRLRCRQDLSDAELAIRVRRHLRLPGVRHARIIGKQVMRETYACDAAPEPKAGGGRPPRRVDHAHTIEDGLITSLVLPRWSPVPRV